MWYAWEGTRLPTSHVHALARARAHTHRHIHARTHVCTPAACLNLSRAPMIVSLTSKAEMMVSVRVSRRSVLSQERSPCRELGSSVQACRCRRKNLPRRREDDATPNRLRLIPNIRIFWLSAHAKFSGRIREQSLCLHLCVLCDKTHITRLL